MRIVLDTSTLISALIVDGKQRTLLNTIIAKNHDIVISRAIIEEFVRITAEPRIQKYVTKEDVKKFLQVLMQVSELVVVKSGFHAVRDKNDNPILATAYDGHASYLVTGDEDLLALAKFRDIKIVKGNEMLKRLHQ